MSDSQNAEFEGGEALRNEAERISKRKLTPEEWETVDPTGWSNHPNNDYNESDLADLLEIISRLPGPTRPSATERQKAQALAFTQRTAAEARNFVEARRLSLFGDTRPPFKDDGRAAASWIEEQAQLVGRSLIELLVAVPRENADGLSPLFWIRDWLDADLPTRDDDQEQHEAVASFLLMAGSPLRRFTYRSPLLTYLGTVGDGWGIKRVYADDSTLLGNLRMACDELAEATEWTQLACVHHMLTGGVVSTPLATYPKVRVGRESFGGSSLTIHIPNPASVRADEVARAYSEARAQVLSVGQPTTRQRASLSPKREKLASFVSENLELTWPELMRRWNKLHPEFSYATHDAMRQAFGRIRRTFN